MLKVDPKKRMLFDPKESVDFNGNTGPFIQYTYARIQSLRRKYTKEVVMPELVEITDREKEIIKQLTAFPALIQESAINFSPALLANYIYDLVKLFNSFYQNIPILGVCLGHQCIGSTFGAKVGYAGEVKHGKVSVITHDEKGVFKNIKNPLKVVRYHSLSIDEDTLPDELEISARSESGVIMGVRHKNYNIEGIQFHPESIFTESGKEIINNFLKNGK